MALSRRAWLATAACGVASTAWTDQQRAAGCLLGFSTYGMKTLSTEEAVRETAAIGFDSIELAVRTGWDADSAKLSREKRKTLSGMLGDTGLRLTSLMEHVFPTNKKNQAVALERLNLAAGVAHDLSPDRPPLIQTVLGGGKFDDVKEPMVERLGSWVELADKTDTTIAVKPHRGGAVSKPSEAVWLLEQLGRPARLRMVYDYSHYAFRDLPLSDTIATALPHTSHIAVKDAVQEGDRVAFQLPGQAGTIDFAQIIREFHAGGYRGDINCEVSGMVSGKPGYDPIEAAKVCYRNLAKAFEAAGVPRS